MSKVLVVPDLHAPFLHPQAVDFLTRLRDTHRPDHVVCTGDELDAHALSRFPHDPDGLGAGTELRSAVDALRPIYELFPKASVCESNHSQRAYRVAYASGLPSAALVSMRQLIDAPRGWRWAPAWEIDGVRYTHGEGGYGTVNPSRLAVTKNHCSMVIGHFHTAAGVYHERVAGRQLFGLSVGCLIDHDAYAFKYAVHNPKLPMLGAAIVEDGELATWVPLR